MRLIQVISHFFTNSNYILGDRISIWQHTDLSTWLYFYTAVLLAMLGLLFITILYARRILISRKDKKIKDLKFRYQYLIYEALIESQAGNGTTNQLIIEKLKKDVRQTSLHKQVLVDLIIDLKKNFSGESEKQFIQLYHALNLSRFSLAKLEAKRWDIQAKGIRELTEMSPDHYETQLAITGLRSAKSRAVAQEAQLASVRMEKNPLSFLRDLQHPLTEWQQIHLHNSLLKTDRKFLPDFTQWLSSANEGVVLFALKMIADFEQQKAEEQVVQCLQHDYISVREEAIRTLIRFRASHTLPHILETCRSCSEDIYLAAIKAAGRMGNTQHVALLEPLLQHPLGKIRLASEHAIKRLKHLAPQTVKINGEIIKNNI